MLPEPRESSLWNPGFSGGIAAGKNLDLQTGRPLGMSRDQQCEQQTLELSKDTASSEGRLGMGRSSIPGMQKSKNVLTFWTPERGKELYFVSPASPTCQKSGKEKTDFVSPWNPPVAV